MNFFPQLLITAVISEPRAGGNDHAENQAAAFTKNQETWENIYKPPSSLL